jgi:putative ABC transport system permease protein
MGSGSEVIVPFSCLYNKWSWIEVTAAAQSAGQSVEAVAQTTFYLRQARHIRPGDDDTFRVDYAERGVEQVNSIILVITEVATGLVGVSLIVGGVGIMNIMLVSVSERTREIGLRKAVGAPPAAILMQFLVEAITLCFFGGAIGVAIGIGLTYFARTLPIHLTKATVPFWAISLAFGFAASVGLIFGMFPAIKASRLDPIEAIRHE